MTKREMKLPEGWYSHSKLETQKSIENYLKNFKKQELKNPVGAIVPHAGWFFSGKLSCQTISLLAQSKPQTVILFGGHLGNEKSRIFLEDIFETPLGDIYADIEFREKIKDFCIDEQKWEIDNTTEIQLPFIKYFFPESKIIIFRSPANEVAKELGIKCSKIAKELNRNVVFIGSLDLTHYGPRYGFAPKGVGSEALRWVKETNDKNIIDFMLKLDENGVIQNALKNQSSCSPGAASSVISASKSYLDNITAKLVDYYTSSDIIKDNNFVGYAGVVYHQS